MEGFVNSRLEAIIELAVSRSFGGSHVDQIVVATVIDIRFSDYLALPISIIRGLNLPGIGEMAMILADGSEVMVDLYEGYIFWHQAWQPIEIAATDSQAILGMALLSDSRVTIDVRDSGTVLIMRLV